MIVSGPSSSGKTVFTRQVLYKSDKHFEKIYWFYSEWQDGYKDCYFILLCTVSHSVSSIKFDMLHVYKQLYTCLYTHLNKYNQLVIVIFLLVLRLSNPLVHYNVLIVYTSYIISHCIPKIYKSYTYLHYKCTRPLLSTTHCHPCHIVQSSI